MVKLFLSILFILFIAIIINRLFDIKMGNWYMCFSLKDYVVKGIFGKSGEHPSSKLSKTAETEAEVKKTGQSTLRKIVPVVKESDVRETKAENGDKKEKKVEREQVEKWERDPISEIIQRVK